MLFAVSGSQGSGKTTTLNKLAETGSKVIQRKTARSILAEYPGKTLDDIYADPDLCMKFHDQILDRKINDEQSALEDTELWFTERSYADLFTYACVSLGKNNRCSEWLNAYYDKCKAMNQRYTKIFYIEGGKFTPEHDGVRGSNPHYATLVDTSMLAFTQQMDENRRNVSKIITTKLTDRVREIFIVSMNAWLDERE